MSDLPHPDDKPTLPSDFEPAFGLYLDLLDSTPGLGRGMSKAAFSRTMDALRDALEAVDAVRVTTRGHYLGHRDRFGPALFALLTKRSPQLEFPQWVRPEIDPSKGADYRIGSAVRSSREQAAASLCAEEPHCVE